MLSALCSVLDLVFNLMVAAMALSGVCWVLNAQQLAKASWDAAIVLGSFYLIVYGGFIHDFSV